MKAPKSKMPKSNHVLIYADFGCVTGFGNVTENIVKNIQEEFGKNTVVHIFAINDHNEKPYEKYGATIFPALFMAANEHDKSLKDFMKEKPQIDVFCRKPFLNFLLANEYNVVFFINDLEIINSMRDDLKQIKRLKKEQKKLRFKTVLYFPIDSVPGKDQVDSLEVYDEIITYTNYAKSVVTELNPKQGNRLKVIPHAIDRNYFYPIPKNEILEYKEKLFGKDKFVIGTVNRNSARKDIATTILAFTEFKKLNPDQNVCLYLHLNVLDFYGLNIPYFVHKLGLELGKDILYPKYFSENKGIPIDDLNKIYNCFDIFITNTTAEGWGLTVTEAMACKIPVIAPMHTSLKEIGEDGKLVFPITILEPVVFLNDGEKVRFKSNFNQTVSTLDFVYQTLILNPESISDTLDAAHKKVTQKNWTEISEEFWAIISKHFKK